MEFRRLGDYVKITTGKLNANASDEDGIYPFFTCSAGTLKINSYSYDCECVLVAGNGDLNVKYYNGKFDAYQRTYIIQSKNDEILNVRFLYYFMSKYVDKLRSSSIGGVIKYIKLKNLTEAEFPLPSLQVQQKIVEVLDKAQTVIDTRKEQISLLDDLVQSFYHDMFNDPVSNPMGWDKEVLKNLCTKIGSGATPRGGKSSYKKEGISLIRSMNVHNGYFKYNDLAFIDENQAEKLKNVIIEPGDVLINITGASVARSCTVPIEVLPARVNQHVALLRPVLKKIDSCFLNYSLINSSYQQHLLKLATSGGATREAINKKQLEELQIPVPPLQLQHKFAEIIKKIDLQREMMRKSLLHMENNYNSLISGAFSGELLSN
ncbi:restriction endonuclease subunit S [Proteinivorax tanatarense]|uniref:Restriction endonuclease subunit S n=1 Tax=Proteinivorax tanatarense TaxID=1260629 RepID=A0AAU7VMJ6_9FIRM